MNRHRHFYVKELAQLKDGRYVALLRWITVKHEVHADVLEVSMVNNHFTVHTERTRRVLAKDLSRNILDIMADSTWSEKTISGSVYDCIDRDSNLNIIYRSLSDTRL